MYGFLIIDKSPLQQSSIHIQRSVCIITFTKTINEWHYPIMMYDSLPIEIHDYRKVSHNTSTWNLFSYSVFTSVSKCPTSLRFPLMIYSYDDILCIPFYYAFQQTRVNTKIRWDELGTEIKTISLRMWFFSPILHINLSHITFNPSFSDTPKSEPVI